MLAGLGIGGIVVPASIMTTIICPDDLIATVAALTLSIRVIGGAVGYTVYWQLLLGSVLVALVLSLPTGIVGTAGRLLAQLRKEH